MVHQGGSTDTGKIQRDEEEILKVIISKVKEFIEYSTKSLAKNIGKKTNSKKLSNRLSIAVNGKTVFQSNMNQQEKIGSVDSENLKKIANAIKDPYNSPDEIRIKLGKQTLFHVDQNKVLVDKLNLSPAPKQEQNLSLEQKIEQLTKIVGQQQKQIDLLERKIENKLNFIALNTAKLQNRKLGNWISDFGSKLYAAWDNVKSIIKNFMNSSIQNVTEKVASVSAGFLEKPVNFMLNKYGKEETPGILSFQGKLYSYSKDMKNGEISISSNTSKNNIVEKGNFTPSASPEDIKLLKDLPERVKSTLTSSQTQTQKKNRGISR